MLLLKQFAKRFDYCVGDFFHAVNETESFVVNLQGISKTI